MVIFVSSSNTTHFKAKLAGTVSNAALVYGKLGGVTSPAKFVYAKLGGVVTMVYSTPTVSVANIGSTIGSGASGSGTTSNSTVATPGGNNSGNLSYAYSYVSGDTGFNNTVGGANPTFTHAFSGVPNGTTSAGVSATWNCRITDNVTGAFFDYQFTIGPYAWQNTIPAYIAPTVSSFNNMGGTKNVAGSTTVTTGDGGQPANPNIIIANGQAPFSYAWADLGGTLSQALVSGGTTLIPVINSFLPNGATAQHTWRMTATDAMSNSCHCDVVVTLDNN